MNNVRFGIIGVGNIGTAHAKYLYEKEVQGAELTAVLEVQEEKIQWVKENLQEVEVFTNENSFLSLI